MLIGVTGLAGSGKDTFGSYLFDHYGFNIKKFAQPLKDMILALPGMDEDFTDGLCKEMRTDLLGNNTCRHAMQTLGTEWGRKCMGENFWVMVFKNGIIDHLQKDNFVVTDVRFGNEATAIQSLGGVVVMIKRLDQTVPQSDHDSETSIELLPYNYLIHNDDTLQHLYKETEALLDLLRKRGLF